MRGGFEDVEAGLKDLQVSCTSKCTVIEVTKLWVQSGKISGKKLVIKVA